MSLDDYNYALSGHVQKILQEDIGNPTSMTMT